LTKKRKNHASHPKESALLSVLTANAARLVKQDKQKVAEIVSDPAQRREMPTVPALQRLKSAKIHRAPMIYHVKSGNVVVLSR
jgi:hypothetical protein